MEASVGALEEGGMIELNGPITQPIVPNQNQHVGRIQGYSNPKDAAYLLRLYPAIMGLVLLNLFVPEKHTPFPTSSPFVIISGLAYSLALLDIGILSWVYDRLKYSPDQHFSPRLYRVLTDTFYILCILAPFSLLLVFFIPHSRPHPHPYAHLPHPPHHNHHH